MYVTLGEPILQASIFDEKKFEEEKLPGLDVEVPATALVACTVFTRVAGVKVDGEEETKDVPATYSSDGYFHAHRNCWSTLIPGYQAVATGHG